MEALCYFARYHCRWELSFHKDMELPYEELIDVIYCHGNHFSLFNTSKVHSLSRLINP